MPTPPPERRLTDTAIRNSKAKGVQYDLPDGVVGGLSVRVSQAGAKTFYLYYRRKRYTIGPYPALSLSQAREQANELKENIKKRDSDPEHYEAEDKLAKKRSATFETVVDEYIEKYAKLNMTEVSWREYRRVLHGTFCSSLGKRAIGSVRAFHIEDIIVELIDDGKPSAARHAHAYIRGFCNWATGRRYFTAASNPCAEVTCEAKAKTRRRRLNEAELGDIYYAASRMKEEEDFQYGDIIRLLILTNMRRGRVAGMRWTAIDLQKQQWTLAPKKRGADLITLPLCATAVDILSKIDRGESDFVFPSRTNPKTHFSGFSDGKERLDILCGCRDKDGKLRWQEDWVPHDFRRTLKSTMEENLWAPRAVIEAMMDHQEPGVAGDYNMAKYLEPMREAYPKWEAYVLNAAKLASSRLKPTAQIAA
jgi:integrase